MKRYHKSGKEIVSIAILFCMPFVFYSCDSYNFSVPQPLDKENIYEFPKALRGKWVEVQETFVDSINFTIPLQGYIGYGFEGNDLLSTSINKTTTHSAGGILSDENDSLVYLVDKKFVSLIIHNRKERIVKGAWPRLNDTGGYIYPPIFYESFQTINHDTLKRPTDTINNYLFRGELIHEIGEGRFLNKGYPFYTEQDTFIVLKIDTTCIDLGQNAFLRQLNKNLFVLNIRNRIVGDNIDEFNEWWRVVLLDIKNDTSINIWECSSKSGELPCMFYDRNSKYTDIFYFDCQWTRTEMLRLMKEGYFEIKSKLSRIKN